MKSQAISSSYRCPFRSAIFRNNEAFLRAFTELTELIDCCSTESERIKYPISSEAVISWFARMFTQLRHLDKELLRAEKTFIFFDGFPDVFALENDPDFSDGLRSVRTYMENQRICRFSGGVYAILNDMSVSLEFELRYRYIGLCSKYRPFLESLSDFLQADHELAYEVIVSVVALSIVYQYLLGHVDRGGTKIYNPGSIEFRDTYVSLLLFRGAYVWIKFRDVASRRVRRRHKKDKLNKVQRDEFGQVQYYDKYEPRFTPPREKGTQKQSYLPLGGYDTYKDAEVVCQIAGFYYGKDEGVVLLEDGSHVSIPVMSEQERSHSGEKKREWVSAKAKAVFKEIREKNASRRPPSDDQDDRVFGCSSSADQSAIEPLAPAFADGYDAFFERLSTFAENHGPLVSNDEGILLDFSLETFDVPMPTLQERLNEELHLQKSQLAAEYDRRLAEELHKNRRLKEENSELRQESLTQRQENLELQRENKRLKTMLQQAANPLRAFFLTSSVELGSSTENC